MKHKDMDSIGSLLGLLVISVGMFFLFSYIFMLLWNSSVVKISKEGNIQKISYKVSLGLMLFLVLFSSTGVVVYNNYPVRGKN